MRTPGHIRVTIATNDLLQANAHFAGARQIVFYDVSRDGHAFEACV